MKSNHQNNEIFFKIGLLFFLAGIIGFLLIVQPWENTHQKKKISSQELPKSTIITAPEKNTPSVTPVPTPLLLEEKKEEDELVLAQKLLKSGEYTAAIKMAEKKIQKSPQNIPALEIIVNANLGATQYLAAEKAMNQLLKRKDTPQNRIKKMEIFLKAGKIKEAQALTPLLPKSAEKVFYQMILAIVTEQNDEIKQYATQLQKSNSQYKKTGEEVLQIFENYKSFRDGSPHYLRAMMANILNILNYHTLTIQYIKPTLEEYPDYRDAWIIMGNSYLELKRFNIAQGMLSKAVSLDPAHPQSPYFLAIALAELGQNEEAIEQFQNAIKNGYTPLSKVYRYIAHIYIRTEEYEKAVEYLQKTIENEKKPQKEDYIKSITLSLTELYSPDLALKTATQMGKKFPKTAETLSILGWVLIEKGDLIAAKKSLLKAEEKDSTYPNTYLFLGELYEKEENEQDALNAYKKGYKEGKGSPISRECAQKYNILKNKINERNAAQ